MVSFSGEIESLIPSEKFSPTNPFVHLQRKPFEVKPDWQRLFGGQRLGEHWFLQQNGRLSLWSSTGSKWLTLPLPISKTNLDWYISASRSIKQVFRMLYVIWVTHFQRVEAAQHWVKRSQLRCNTWPCKYLEIQPRFHWSRDPREHCR